MKAIVYQPAARKALRKMPRNTAMRIVGKIEQYADDPATLRNNVKALAGRDGMRLRVGNWRIIMLAREVLDILDIGSRGGIYD